MCVARRTNRRCMCFKFDSARLTNPRHGKIFNPVLLTTLWLGVPPQGGEGPKVRIVSGTSMGTTLTNLVLDDLIPSMMRTALYIMPRMAVTGL